MVKTKCFFVTSGGSNIWYNPECLLFQMEYGSLFNSFVSARVGERVTYFLSTPAYWAHFKLEQRRRKNHAVCWGASVCRCFHFSLGTSVSGQSHYCTEGQRGLSITSTFTPHSLLCWSDKLIILLMLHENHTPPHPHPRNFIIYEMEDIFNSQTPLIFRSSFHY